MLSAVRFQPPVLREALPAFPGAVSQRAAKPTPPKPLLVGAPYARLQMRLLLRRDGPGVWPFAVLLGACLLAACVLDPQRLFPSEGGDGATTLEAYTPDSGDKVDPKAGCYKACTGSGTDTRICKAKCYPATDPKVACYESCIGAGKDQGTCVAKCCPAIDPTTGCYEPCIKKGKDPADCGKLCYGGENPAQKCLVGCLTAGLKREVCDGRSKAVGECVKTCWSSAACLGKCRPDPIYECYVPCLQTGSTAESCTASTQKVESCLTLGKEWHYCLGLCTAGR